jgi:hypothetical protein
MVILIAATLGTHDTRVIVAVLWALLGVTLATAVRLAFAKRKGPLPAA